MDKIKVGDRIKYIGPGRSKYWRRLKGAFGKVASVRDHEHPPGAVIYWIPDESALKPSNMFAFEGEHNAGWSSSDDEVELVSEYVVKWKGPK